ncbi:MAG: hypothetical protein HYY46_10150, partial [Deltaproteobacteria bacterium]|nr:hypothetical protein [Deltaproteobacteria bacterium]
MKRIPLILLIALLVGASAWMVYALDPPHSLTNPANPCRECHKPHNAEGGAITILAGNANLCESCHYTGYPGMTKPFYENDQALPG